MSKTKPSSRFKSPVFYAWLILLTLVFVMFLLLAKYVDVTLPIDPLINIAGSFYQPLSSSSLNDNINFNIYPRHIIEQICTPTNPDDIPGFDLTKNITINTFFNFFS